MALFSKRRPEPPRLTREESLSACPVLNRLVRLERGEGGKIVLQVPRRNTSLARTVSRFFKLPLYRRVALDELGTFVVELCDGENSVRDIVDKFAKAYRLNRREAELSMLEFLRNLTRRSIVGMVIGTTDD